MKEAQRAAGPALHTTDCFRVRIDGREIALASVSRLSTESELATSEEAEPGVVLHRRPRVTLERALDDSRELFAWRQAILEGKDDRRDVEIELLASAGGACVTSWRLRRAWPVRWSGPAFDGLKRELATEQVELECERLEWR